MDISIINHQTKLSIADFIDDLMQKRVRQGKPEMIDIILNDQPISAFLWTDGVNSFQTAFYALNLQFVLEITIKLDPQNQ
jgi:hypothetical protein